LLEGQFLHRRKLARKWGAYQQKETCRLEIAFMLNCSLATSAEQFLSLMIQTLA
jgi:hypothetical protein